MKKMTNTHSEECILNTNETMHDYSFFLQMFFGNKIMDFDVKGDEYLCCEEGVLV